MALEEARVGDADERLCAFIEVGCDGNEQGVERLLEALTWLAEEIKKRKASPAHV